MRGIISGEIVLTGYTSNEAAKIREHLSIDDPDYHKRIRMNPRARHFLSPQVKYYEETKDGRLIVPRGAGEWLRENFRIAWEDRSRKSPAPKFPEFKGRLRTYQEGLGEAVAARRQGLLVLSTGFGKTVVGLYVASLLKQRTLVLCPNTAICEQFRNDVKTFLGIEAGRKGDEDAVIVVETIQAVTASVRTLETVWLQSFGLVIYDEAQGSPALKARGIWRHIPAFYRYGLTATPDRTDGQGAAIWFLFGETLVERTLERAKPRVQLHNYQGAPGLGVYHEMIAELVEDEERNIAIAELIAKQKRKTIVLTKRIKHYEEIATHLPRKLRVFVIESKLSPKKRQETLDYLRQNLDSFDVILGTFSLLGAGLDIPALDCLVIAGDLKSPVLTRQAIGRIERLMEGKPDPIVHDIVDINNPILYRQAKFRQKLYREHVWPTTVCPLSSKTSSTLSDDRLRSLFSGSSNQF